MVDEDNPQLNAQLISSLLCYRFRDTDFLFLSWKGVLHIQSSESRSLLASLHPGVSFFEDTKRHFSRDMKSIAGALPSINLIGRVKRENKNNCCFVPVTFSNVLKKLPWIPSILRLSFPSSQVPLSPFQHAIREIQILLLLLPQRTSLYLPPTLLSLQPLRPLSFVNNPSGSLTQPHNHNTKHYTGHNRHHNNNHKINSHPLL